MSTDNVLTNEQILQAAQCLTSEVGIDGEYVVLKNVNGCIRAIEQAVLQSEQVQSWRRDAERLKYLLGKVCMYQAADYGCKFEILNLPPHFGDCEPDPGQPFLAAIDHARRVEGEGK